MNKYDIIAWLFPNKCLICGDYLRANFFVCCTCINTLEIGVERSYNINMGKSSKLFKVYSPYNYIENYRKVMDRYKFNGKTAYARKFSGFIYNVYNDEFFQNYNLITYIPMLKKKKKERGYNQAELIAKNLSCLLKIDCRETLLKLHENKIQHSLNAKERKENIRGLYRVSSDVIGQNIIIVDDIITTGATLCECARMLYRAGANSVLGICAANTPSKTIERLN